jgi:RimJ/RimL family protein N-acetyltransferase
MSVILTTDRLVLREFSPEDAPFVIRLLNSEGWLKYIGDRQVRSVEQAQDYLERIIFPGYRSVGSGFRLMELRDGGLPIGLCGVIKRDYLEFPDIGYALLPEYERKGFATEAVSATLRHVQENPANKVICAIVTPGNGPSIRLLERTGFTYQKTIMEPAEMTELLLYVREEQQA